MSQFKKIRLFIGSHGLVPAALIVVCLVLIFMVSCSFSLAGHYLWYIFPALLLAAAIFIRMIVNRQITGTAETAAEAIRQHGAMLKKQFPQIVSVSDAVHNIKKKKTHVVLIYLENDQTKGIPHRLKVSMPDGSVQVISTVILKGGGSGEIHISQKDEIRNGESFGSVCCLVETFDGTKVLTAGHVYSNGRSDNYGGELDITQQTEMLINRVASGNWFFQLIDEWNDIALAGIEEYEEDPDCISFKDKGFYQVGDHDVKKTRVKVISFVSQPRERDAYILDYNTSWDVRYTDKRSPKSGIIVIGSSSDRQTSVSVSRAGDSGGCVYEPVSGKLVGLILGGNKMFTWVLPVEDIINKFNYKLT